MEPDPDQPSTRGPPGAAAAAPGGQTAAAGDHRADARGQQPARRDATLISVLAYAGLGDTKTAAHRTVRLLPPLAADLRKWRLLNGRPAAKALIFPSATGTVWSQPAYQSWRRRAFKRSLDGAGVEHARPYDLRHSYATLLLHEGRSVIYVARQLGHDARLTLSTYGHVMDAFEEAPQLDAHTAIANARAALANEEPKLRRQ